MPLSPPVDFPSGLLAHAIPTGTSLFRIHHEDNGPLWFGPKPSLPAAYRFDAERGEYRTLYSAETLDGAFAETILHKPTGRIVRRKYVEERAWTVLKTRRPFKLAKLYDNGLRWHGTDASISASDTYVEARRMALALHQTFPEIDGIAYRACHDNGEICFALFDRVKPDDISPSAAELFRNHRATTDTLMSKYGAIFDDSAPVPPA